MATFSENERGQASAKIWLASTYVNDLKEFAEGDENRFGRMVDSRGVSVANPGAWLKKIANIVNSPVVQHFYASKIQELIGRLVSAGFSLPEQER